MQNNTQRLWGSLSLIAFFSLLSGVVTDAAWLRRLDRAAFAIMQRKTAGTITAFKLIARLGSPLIAIGATVLLGAFVWYRLNASLGLFIIASQFVGSALAEVVKMLVGRLRPTQQLVADTGFSFPSGHTFCTALFVACVLLVLLPRLADPELQLLAVLIAAVWVVLVAIARVYLRDHYASDVLASITLAGGYWGWLMPVRARIQAIFNRMLPQSLKGSH